MSGVPLGGVSGKAAGTGLLAALALLAIGASVVAARSSGAAAAAANRRSRRPPDRVRSARRLNVSAGALALSVLTDSALEHYRGSFHNPAMLAPLLSAALSVAASTHGSRDPRGRSHATRNGIYAAAVATGLVGTAFHVYNIGKRTGGISASNLFYAAPIGAPAALILSGLIGAASERARAGGRRARVVGMPLGKALMLLASLGLAGTAGEAALLHFRGAYHNPAMYLPVSLPPLAAGLLARSAFSEAPRTRFWSRWMLRLTVLLGTIGAGFHTYGVSRNMGGFRNWTQNLLSGPPLPAPPSFSAMALAGLAALDLHADER